MAAINLYYGKDLVGGEVDPAEINQLKTDVEANKTAITNGDAATLAAANKHSDDNDVVTLAAANKHSDDNDVVTLAASKKYTDDEIARIFGSLTWGQVAGKTNVK